MFDLKKLHKIQEYFSVDSLLHFSFSYVIMGILYLAFNVPVLIAAVVTFLVGLAKECYVDDVFSTGDLKADLIGILFFMLCLL